MTSPSPSPGATVDLSDVPVVDNHCHAVEASQQTDLPGWRAYFSESPDPSMRSAESADTAFYRRLIARMARLFSVDPTEEAVLEARARTPRDELLRLLFADAGIQSVVVDTGYPAPALALPAAELTSAAGCHQASLLRLEVAFEPLVAAHSRLEELLDAVRSLLAGARSDGWAGFKSIVGYRTGLAVTRWDRAAVQESFAAARAEVDRTGRVRLGHKPLLDSLLHLAFEAAAAQELPVQFHVGYGDPDVDLRTANPLCLREVLEEPAYRPMPVVLLHGCWPYFREGAYLASVYGNAFLDVSYAIPFLSVGELTSMTRAVLGTAPFGKVMYSSDGARVPELHWMGAHDGRRAIGTVLSELVADGDLSPEQARRVGERVLLENALRVYGIDGTAR